MGGFPWGRVCHDWHLLKVVYFSGLEYNIGYYTLALVSLHLDGHGTRYLLEAN